MPGTDIAVLYGVHHVKYLFLLALYGYSDLFSEIIKSGNKSLKRIVHSGDVNDHHHVKIA